MPFIKLQSSDDEIFVTDIQVATCSGTIKSMLESCVAEDEAVPLPNVNSAILRKVLEWAEYHKSDLKQSTNEDDDDTRTDDITPWDQKFLQVDQGTLFELTMAANYLNIQGLLKVACKTVANMIKGKTPEDIRQTFNIKNDFTLAEEELVRMENEWHEEN
ncbi:S-phase kinase-associated protein 1-like [Drosophila innubila]|uniref:S-phase kinase-associated protein 1-like n=1 Tax=Drosophila innubila TaxID=198719 RepID=UPI00148DC2FF|nr:S-phase kinase-associated protein 1-like [Drosophila innubila]